MVIHLSGTLSDDHYQKLFDDFELLGTKGKYCVAITDARQLEKAANPAQRKDMAERLKGLERRGLKQLGSVVVLESAVMRGAQTAMNWLTKHNLGTAKNMDEAFEKARQILNENALAIPPGLIKAQSG